MSNPQTNLLDLRPSLIRKEGMKASVRPLPGNKGYEAFTLINQRPFRSRGRSRKEAMSRLITGINDYLAQKEIGLRLKNV